MTVFATDRVIDLVANLSYQCPPGWLRDTDCLAPPFSTAISDGSGAMVASGTWADLPAEAPSADHLITGAAWLASDYGEVFLAAEGQRTNVVIENASVAGCPAARAGYDLIFDPAGGEPGYVRSLVVALPNDLVSFLLAVGPDALRHVVDGVLASTKPVKP